jgi:hypothetical protein
MCPLKQCHYLLSPGDSGRAFLRAPQSADFDAWPSRMWYSVGRRWMEIMNSVMYDSACTSTAYDVPSVSVKEARQGQMPMRGIMLIFAFYSLI